MQYHRGADLNMKVNANPFWQVLTLADLTIIMLILCKVQWVDACHVNRVCAFMHLRHGSALYDSTKKKHI